MRRTRILAAALAVSALVLTGCSTTTADDAAAGGGSSPSADRGGVKKILFDYPFTFLPVYGAIRGIVEKTAADAGVEVTFTNDDGDLQKQVSQLTSNLGGDIDAVVSFPVDPSSLESIAQQYKDAGKYWVTYGGDMKNQDASLKFSFYKSGHDLGVNAAQWALDNVGPNAKVIIVSDRSRQIGSERTQGILDGLKETAPDLQIVGDQQAVAPDEALSVTTALLAKDPDVNLVLTSVGDAAQGAYQALVASGRAEDDPKTYVGGLDPNLFGLQKMSEGKFFRAATYFSLSELVSNVINIPVSLGKGEKDASVDLPVEIVTADNPNLKKYITELGG